MCWRSEIEVIEKWRQIAELAAAVRVGFCHQWRGDAERAWHDATTSSLHIEYFRICAVVRICWV